MLFNNGCMYFFLFEVYDVFQSRWYDVFLTVLVFLDLTRTRVC